MHSFFTYTINDQCPSAQSTPFTLFNILIDEGDLKLDDSAEKEGTEIASEICDTKPSAHVITGIVLVELMN